MKKQTNKQQQYDHLVETLVLNKYLAHAGVASRRGAVDLIKDGLVRVNGVVITDPAHQVLVKDHVKVGSRLVALEKKIYLLLNKPVGFVTTVRDEQNRPTVMSLVTSFGKSRLYPVGRLDYNTSGLLLITNDGALAQRLAHPKFKIKKSYRVTLDRSLTPDDLEKIKKGVYLPDGAIRVDAIKTVFGTRDHVILMTLHSGRYRVIRRLFIYLGYNVRVLERIEYASLTLAGVAPGRWRHLSDAEVISLKDGRAK